MTNDVLLTVSGVIGAEIHDKVAQGERPEADYLAMAREFPADLLDYTAARQMNGIFGKFLERIGGPNLSLAWACFRKRKNYRVIFTDGEQVGLPLALFFKFFAWKKRPRHLMIAHLLSASKKVVLLDNLKLLEYVDVFFVYSTWQKNFIQSCWGLPKERVIFTPFMVNAEFFAPSQSNGAEFLRELNPQRKPMICSAGLEFRDYPTLIEAVRGMDIQVIIAAASPWSKREDSTANEIIPDNVVVRGFSQYELREIYAASEFIVMPLYEVNFQAGVTAILEAMAMEKAVICTRTPGQTDVVVEGETGLYVSPGNPHALRDAIRKLLSRPDEATRMGRNARRKVLTEMSLECYTKRLKEYLS